MLNAWKRRATVLSLVMGVLVGCERNPGNSEGTSAAEQRETHATTLSVPLRSAPVQSIVRDGRRRVILNLKPQAHAKLVALQERVATRLGADLGLVRRFKTLPAVVGWITPRGAALAALDPDILSIQDDAPVEAHLAESVPLLGADTVQNNLNVKGTGVRVAVLDTGIATAHPDLADSVVAQHCFTHNACSPGNANEGTSAEDDNGHGTNVAGIITSNGTIASRGFAPDAELVALKVLAADASGFLSDWVAGLDWIVANQATLNVRVVNISLGTTAHYTGNCDATWPTVATAVAELNALGISVFASTGNQGSSNSIASPACNSGVIAVGATYDASLGRQPASGTWQSLLGGGWPACFDANADASTVACFTDSNALLDVLAPGMPMTSTGLSNGTSTYGGTSQATPVAAAVAALMLQCKPSLTPAQVESTLETTGTSLTDSRNGLSFPRITALGAVNTACAPCAAQGNGTSCSDGNACTIGDSCQSAICVGGTAQTCSGQGSCNTSTGACTCSVGFAGSTCQYSDAVTCNAHGIAQANGSCNCSPGFAGSACQYGDATTCSGHGTAQPNGSCTCATGFAGASCQYSDAVTCNAHGTAQPNGFCVCASGFAGSSCQYSDAITCNSHGTAQANGSCSCSGGFSGPACQYGDATTCSGHGTAEPNGSCNCATGFAGASCQYSDAVTCNGHGTAQANGSCSCSAAFTGSACNQCAPNYYAYPTCSFCDPMITCGGHGSCNGVGACSCTAGFAGSSCQYSDAVTCNGHGTAQANGSCSCTAGFAGTSCQYSDAVTCNAHGVAQANGACVCSTAFDGATCDQCAPGYSPYPTCSDCDAAVSCGGHGTCNGTGGCTCSTGFAGSSCQHSDAVTCSGHGTAQPDGSCVCSAGFAGSSCQHSDAVTCSGHGMAQPDGSCICGSEFGGTTCAECAANRYGYPTCTFCEPSSCAAPSVCRAPATCNVTGQCAYALLPNGTECDDGNASTTDDACSAGTCIGTAQPIGADASVDSGIDGGNDAGVDAAACATGFAGSSCQYGDDLTCNGRGTAQDDGSCDCSPEFEGAACDECAADHYAYPECTFCEASSCEAPDDCHEQATCDSNGACAYAVKDDGTACDDHDDQTKDDQCSEGVCSGVAKSLDAGDDATKPNPDPHDASNPFNPDASGQDAGANPASTESSGCACSLPHSPSGSWSSLVSALLVGLASLCRYRKT